MGRSGKKSSLGETEWVHDFAWEGERRKGFEMRAGGQPVWQLLLLGGKEVASETSGKKTYLLEKKRGVLSNRRFGGDEPWPKVKLTRQ